MNKKNLILTLVLAALIAVAYIYKGPLEDWREKKAAPKNFLAGIETDKIDLIEITYGGEKTIIEKTGQQTEWGTAKWKIKGTKEFYIEENLSDEIGDSLKEAGVARMQEVSADKEKKADFLVSEELGAKIALYQGQEKKVEFMVGKTGYNYDSSYVAFPDSDSTYLMPVSLNFFNRGNWYDRSIFSLDGSKFSKLRFQYPDRQFSVEKRTEADGEDINEWWEGVEPDKFRVDEDKINEILHNFSFLSAVDIPEQNFSGTGLEKNNLILQVTGSGIDSTLLVGDQNEDGHYFALRIGSDNIYLISEEQKNIFDVSIRDLQDN